jgi:hypothetical protein
MTYREPIDIHKAMKMMISTNINSMKKIMMDMMMIKLEKKKEKKIILIKL